MKEKGISGKLFHILPNFLSNRKQRVVLNGQNSSWNNAHTGVSQGFILSPLLFLIYIYDLSDNLTSNTKVSAHDTSLFAIVQDVNTPAKELNNDLKIFNDLFFQWKMSFNPDPSKVLFIHKTKKPIRPPLVFNSNIFQTFSQKQLGVKFEDHLNNVLAKINQAAGPYTNFEIYYQGQS